MIKVVWQPVSPAPTKLRGDFGRPINSFVSSRALLCVSEVDTKLSTRTFLECFCTKNDTTHEPSSQSFSALAADTPWDSGTTWSTMAFYTLTLHIPLSFGWISVVTQILQQPVLDPNTKAISLLIAQTLELIATLILLKYTAKPQHNFLNFFKGCNLSKERNWLLASAIGFGFLFTLVLGTSLLANGLLEPKPVNNPILKEILESSDISKASCALVYCLVAPLLEETVYRGFLLGSLSTTMKWQQAVLISSAIFSAAHLSGENFLQLFIIGCVLGCSYCWTGNLRSSLLIHSFYNAMTLLITFLS
ncbi:hypothetical protein UlMin_014238 [Ulmus minor]